MKKKYFIVGITIILIGSLITTSIYFKNSKQEEKKYLSKEETSNMLSYTLDGEKTDEKPTKESGYIANKITCENNSNLIWDNTNWEIELLKLESNDRCNVDFTKDVNTSGYRVSVTTNVEGSVDSLSKTTIENGKIVFYPNEGYEITSVSGCTGKLEDGKVVISSVSSNQTCNVVVKEPLKTLYATLTDGVKYPIVNTRTNFDESLGGTTIDSSYDTTGVIYKESVYKESGKDVYYFAGNPQDNWIKFAGFYWRIIRTNEDGSVRLLYAGTSPDTTEGYITSTRNDGTTGTTTWYGPDSGTYCNTMYVGWMYGTEGSIANNRQNTTDSGAKTFLDNWYENAIANNSTYSNMVSRDAIYCNDRASGAYASSGIMWYAAYARLAKKYNSLTGNQPSYQCGQNAAGGYFASGSASSGSTWTNSTAAYTSSPASSADKFSVTTGSGGNGQLKYPVGLMTADEVAFAGGLYVNKAPNTYYYRNSVTTGCTGASGDPCSVTGTTLWWTMSPCAFGGSGHAYVFSVLGSGSNPGFLTNNGVPSSGAIRPVLSLKPEVLVSSGTGTSSDPFIPIL